MTRIYRHDLAWIQHLGFGGFAEAVAPGVLDALRGSGITEGLVVDLGCGDGRLARKLCDAGYDVLGVDASEPLIRIAERVAPSARFVVGSLHEVELPQADAIVALGKVLAYGAEEDDGRPGLADTFGRLRRHLRPGGPLIFDLVVAGDGPALEYRTWTTGDGWTVLVEVREDRESSRVVRQIVTFLRSGPDYRRSEEHHVLSIFEAGTVEETLRAAGFTVRTSRSYGEFPLPPRRLAFVARRRPDG